MEACLGAELPAPTELEEGLRNGVLLAQLGHRFAPKAVKKIYDPEQLRYQAVGLQFRHTDNINHWRNAMTTLGLPAIFQPETTDVYDKKNMPRAVYCIHALSLYLYRRGLAPQIQDLYGKVKFTEEEINHMKAELDKYGIQMPAFNKIGGILANELSVDEAAGHAAVIAINEAVDRGRVEVTAEALRNPNALIADLQEALMSVYQEMLHQAKARKKQQAHRVSQEENDIYEELLTQREIQGNIKTVNVDAAVQTVNASLRLSDPRHTVSCLMTSDLQLPEVFPFAATLYHGELQLLQRQTGELQQEELFVAVEMLSAVALINQAVEAGHLQQVSSSLVSPSAGLSDVDQTLLDRYFECLVAVKQQSRDLLTWNQLQEGINSVNNSVQDEHQRNLVNEAVIKGSAQKLLSALLLPSCGVEEVLPANTCRYLTLLTRARQHKAQVTGHYSVSNSHSRSALWRSSEALVARLQALSRGFLLRQKLEARRLYLTSQTPAVITIQVREYYHDGGGTGITHWAILGYSLLYWATLGYTGRKYRARLRFFRRHVGAVIKIQAFFRANRAREQYRLLVHSATPPLSVVRKFVHLLDLGDADIREEAEQLRLREEVVRSIRFNRQLEVTHSLNKEQLSDMMDLERCKGLKALSRGRRERLEAYQHLFYLLQTQPLYLAQLIFLMPQSRSTSFMEMLVFSLFNYGSDCREAFLLLQLFTEALRYEIRLKVEQPQDVVTGNPTVIKMLVNFYRNARGQNALRESLGPALQEVLLDRTLSIRTDPVDVYKTWINQTETQTGHKSSLPYEVSPADALSHPEVQRRIDIAIINLKNLTDRVLKAITSNLHKLPYGLRYTAKVLRDALKAKFPEASEDEVYKIVSNLVYYRYMNPAVVAPDGFDVVDRSAGSSLQPEQRHILGSVARMLQHAAANKHFHGDGYHVRALNQYISQTHDKFRKFLLCVCDVPEPEDRFNIDEYSELLIVNKPVVYISVSELLNTHQLLLEQQEVLCPDPSDPLRLLLKDLGSVPTLQELIGTTSSTPGTTSSLLFFVPLGLLLLHKNTSGHQKTSLEPVGVGDPGSGLRSNSKALTQVNTHTQEVCHDWLIQQRAQQDARTPEKMKRNQSLVANGQLSLQEKKRKILRCLRRLEGLGVLRPPQTSDQILQMIAKDIRQQRLHRQRRGAELQKLRQTLGSLQAKSSFHSEQVDYYRHYITSCLDNLTAKSKSTNKKAAESKGKKKLPALSYSATRLQEKGVLLEIEDLPSTQFRNVVFDIVPAAENGSFSVKARFLGVEMEEFLLKYQDLLQLQYEGVAVMKMFDKAKVNVNLLIFLLNKKFFKK
uniref:IQ motif containing GTPase activating protein 3 n=1 Tax=Cyclopterus lumpus TaxID=8103 RepID=A0A8C3ATW4_CYCLU